MRRHGSGIGRGARGRGKRILRARAAPGSARGALGPPRQELADGACAMFGALRKRGRRRKTPWWRAWRRRVLATTRVSQTMTRQTARHPPRLSRGHRKGRRPTRGR